ncbi:hypothetical protein DFH07DRAFT_1010679 [Mycena maculata]|uniref:C2H2-type domain-containing protein n=1 Tax=Mycena maculata TaxID=230809 RepID=A0AAD7P0A9_9AGAR|nr:hypothetical protein DFH07DRAFT_1010679 [Mycena maculata]
MAEIASAAIEGVSVIRDGSKFFKQQLHVGTKLQNAFRNMSECITILDRDKSVIPETDVRWIKQWYDRVLDAYLGAQNIKHFPKNLDPRNIKLARDIEVDSARLLASTRSSSQAARRQCVEAYLPDEPVRKEPRVVLARLAGAIRDIASEDPAARASLPYQTLNRIESGAMGVNPSNYVGSELVICRWHNCTQNFPDTEALYTHLFHEHTPASTKKTRCCGWKSCGTSWTEIPHVANHLRGTSEDSVTLVGANESTVHAPAARFDSQCDSGPGSSRTVVETGLPPMPAYEIDEEDSESMHDWKEGKPIIRPMPSNPEINPWLPRLRRGPQ